MEINVLLALLIPFLSIVGVFLIWIYKLGKKVGKLEDCPGKIDKVNEKLDNLSDRLIVIETKIDNNSKSRRSEDEGK